MLTTYSLQAMIRFDYVTGLSGLRFVKELAILGHQTISLWTLKLKLHFG